MNDADKTKEQLLDELVNLRQQIAQLQTVQHQHEQTLLDRDACLIREQATTVEATAAKLALEQEDQALKAAHEQTEAVLESISDSVVSFDAEWRFTYLNAMAEQTFGIGRSHLLGQVIWELFPELKNSQGYHILHRAFAEQKTLSYEEFYPFFDRWFSVRVYPSLQGVTAYALDITQHKQTKQRLRMYADIVNNIQIGLAVWQQEDPADPNSLRLIDSNPAANQITQTDFAALVGTRLSESFPSLLDSTLIQQYNQVIQTQEAIDVGEVRYGDDRITGVYSIKAFPLPDRCVGVAFEDVSPRKQIENDLRDALRTLNFHVENSPLAFVEWNSDYQVSRWSPRAEALFGWSAEEILGKHPEDWQFVHPDDVAEVQAVIENLVQGQDQRNMVRNRNFTKDGAIVHCEWYSSALVDEQGNLESVLCLVLDVTERVQAEAAIQTANHQTALSLEREQAARQVAELNIRRLSQLQKLTEALAPALTFNDITNVWLDWGLSTLNATRAWIAQLTPDRTHLEMLGLVGYSPAEVRDYQKTPLTANLPATDAVRSQQIVVVRSPQDYQNCYPSIADRFIASGSQSLVAIPLMLEDRVTGCLGLSFAEPNSFTESDCAVMLTMGRQCAQALERARLYKEEHLSRKAAESANRIKDEFLAVLSHELRSPLNPILGWSKLLRSRRLDAATTDRALETIERNAQLQTQLIEDLLDVSRILRGKLNLNIAPVNLVNTIESAMETVRLAAEAKAIALQFSICDPASVCDAATPAPFLISGDSARLQQVIWNLLSNAVKFTPPNGRVDVRLERLSAEDEQWDNTAMDGKDGNAAIVAAAQITVLDTGRGINPEFLPHVFDYFRQADSTTTRQFGGLGLGLAIVRHLVELHGGTVTATSPGEGLGSAFRVRFPLLYTEPAPLVAPPTETILVLPAPLLGLRVLVVDDDADMREFAAFVLNQAGANVIVTASAQEALQVLTCTQPDLLLSDIGMPEMDGYMLLRHIRTKLSDRLTQIPAIALTAYAGEYNQQQAIAAGFQRHLSKPIEPEVLIDAIARLVNR